MKNIEYRYLMRLLDQLQNNEIELYAGEKIQQCISSDSTFNRPNWAITNYGRIWSIHRKKFIQVYWNNRYLYYTYAKKNKTHSLVVNKIVKHYYPNQSDKELEAYLSNNNQKFQTHHILSQIIPKDWTVKNNRDQLKILNMIFNNEYNLINELIADHKVITEILKGNITAEEKQGLIELDNCMKWFRENCRLDRKGYITRNKRIRDYKVVNDNKAYISYKYNSDTNELVRKFKGLNDISDKDLIARTEKLISDFSNDPVYFINKQKSFIRDIITE